MFTDEEAWDVLEDIPNDSAAALILLEHHWAVPLRDAIARAGGFRISDGFISPLDLVEIGLVSAEEAEQLHAIEKGSKPAPTRSEDHHDGISQSRPTHLTTRRPTPLTQARRDIRVGMGSRVGADVSQVASAPAASHLVTAACQHGVPPPPAI